MNAILDNRSSTVLAAGPTGDRPHRRHRVGRYALPAAAVSSFNQLLDRLQAAPMDEDRIASIGRSLSPDPALTSTPPWISLRMRDGAAVRLMLGDPAWEPLESATGPARLVSGYLRDHDDLIPDRLPALGRLDDAIVVQAAWPRIGAEVLDYLDYRRLRRLEAGLRGCTESGFRFGRGDWEQARRAEAALVLHIHQVGCRSYLAAASGGGRFRIG